MKNWIQTLLVATLTFTAGCSQQNREADSGISEEKMAEIMQNMLVSSGASSVRSLAESGGDTVIYYSEDGPLGPAHSIVSMLDLDFIGLSGHSGLDLDRAQVLFVEGGKKGEGQREAGLVVQVQVNGSGSSTAESFFTSESVFEERRYYAVFSLPGGSSLLIESFDVVKGEADFKPVIQFKVYELLADGSEEYLGKFSTLVGFDPY